MKNTCIVFYSGVVALLLFSNGIKAQTTPAAARIADPWKTSELLDPAALAGMLKTGDAPLIYNIGAVEDIKTAKHIGPVSDAKNLVKFKEMIAALPKNTPVVIYCGCCALPKCPNVRPAYKELKAAGFTNVSVLNLAVNLKTGWINQGFPLAEK